MTHQPRLTLVLKPQPSWYIIKSQHFQIPHPRFNVPKDCGRHQDLSHPAGGNALPLCCIQIDNPIQPGVHLSKPQQFNLYQSGAMAF